jgi:hypothetical protein
MGIFEPPVRIIHNQDDGAGIRIYRIRQIFQTPGEINFGAGFGYFDVSLGREGFKTHKQIGYSVTNIFIVIYHGLARLGGKRGSYFANELPIGFVKAYHGTFFIIGEFINL